LDERFGGGELRGTINPALDRIEITGTARYDSIEPADSLRLVLVRRPDEHVEHEAQLEQYYIDLGNVVDAIASYARKNDDRLPPNLEALVPEYLTDDTRFARSNERIITYDPSAVPVPGFLQHGWAFSVADVDEMFVREAELERFWQPGFLASRPLLVAEYPADGIVYEAVSMLDVYVVQSPEFPGLDVLQPPPRTESSWQSKCAQQIGQIAKGAKGFQKQHLTNRFPPGLHTLQSFSPIFREFFTCPSVEPGTLSYALAFPAANDDELDAIYHAVAADATAVDADRDATLPLVVELHPCAGGYARHVAYLNGEVELLTPDEWRARVKPFLNAAP
jgi:hypothetical protein